MTKRHPEINQDILSNLCCYLAPNKHCRKINFDTDSFEICANYGASSCTTPDGIYFIPGTYKHLTGVKISGIDEGLKVAGCRSVSWIIQDYKKKNIELIIERVLQVPGFPIWLIYLQQVAKQTENIGNGLHAEKDEAHSVFGGLKFTKNRTLTVTFPYIILSMEFPNLRHKIWNFITMSKNR